MGRGNVFVTVGTTKFDNLIKTITCDEVLKAFVSLGYDKIILQIGHGTFKPEKSDIIPLEYYRLKPSIKDDIQESSLVISHAGAGSCLEILNQQKPLIAVINEDLMGNHQFELATALEKRGYLKYCTCKDLRKTLLEQNLENLKRYPPGDPKKFVDYLNICVGFDK